MTTKTMNQPASSLIKTLAIEVAVPTGVYYALHSLGASDFTALAVSGVFPLARTLFHCMVRFGPKLEKRQAVLGRLVEIGAELLAITAACSRALALAKLGSGEEGRGAIQLADLFSRQARRRVEEKFAAVFDNDDLRTYEVAQQVLRNEHTWMETGMVREEKA